MLEELKTNIEERIVFELSIPLEELAWATVHDLADSFEENSGNKDKDWAKLTTRFHPESTVRF